MIQRPILIALIACAAAGGSPLAGAATADPLPLASVISQIKRELAAAQRVPGASANLALEKVEISLSVSRAVDANGKITIGVPAVGAEIGAGGSRKSDDLSTLQVELVPPKPTGLMSGEETRDFGLTQMIVEARRQLSSGLNEEPKLDPRKVVMTVKFTVQRSGGPTGNLKFAIVSLSGGATIASADTQTVVLTFSKAAP